MERVSESWRKTPNEKSTVRLANKHHTAEWTFIAWITTAETFNFKIFYTYESIYILKYQTLHVYSSYGEWIYGKEVWEDKIDVLPW